jgi:tripartite-type tricarboxylate transporter receptor subunit TctC
MGRGHALDKCILSLDPINTELSRSDSPVTVTAKMGTGTLKKILWLAVAALVACWTAPSQAQTYPTKPIRLIVPFPPGGGTDLTARIAAEALTKSLGQNVIVENRAGAASQIGIEVVAKAPKDGYTLLWASADGISVLPAVKTVPYKVPESFTFISSFASYPLILGVNAKLPISNFQDFIDYARAHPGKLHFGSSGAGGGGHLHPAYIGHVIGADMVHVPFDGAAPAVVAVAGGFADFCDVAPSSVASYISSGTIRGIVTSSKTRSSLLPNVPTMAEAGHPDLSIDLYYGLLGPANLPQPVVDKLRAGVEAVLRQQATIDRLHALGLEPLDLGEGDFASFAKTDAARWQTIAAAVNVHIGG